MSNTFTKASHSTTGLWPSSSPRLVATVPVDDNKEATTVSTSLLIDNDDGKL